MPEPGAEIKLARFSGDLNEHQRRRLASTCRYIDGLLCDMEHALHSADSQSPFPGYVPDIGPAQMRVIEDHIRRLRAHLLRVMARQRMKPEAAAISVTQSLMTDLAFIDNAVEELKPRYMRGYGSVAGDAADELDKVVHELRASAASMDRYLRKISGANPESKAKP
jgi:hypothetical protein